MQFNSLPKSENRRFWRGDVELVTMPENYKCSHEFVRRAGNSIECNKCHAGYRLDHRFTLKNGSIFYKSKKIL